jgi:AcrR family transcriptional regulator
VPRRIAAGPPRAPGRPRSERAERAILAATLDLLAEHGVTGLTMEAVAARAGVAKTTVYRRWSTKEELVVDTLVQLKGPVPAAPAGPVRESLCLLLNRMRAGWQTGGSAGLMRRLIGDADDYPQLTEAYWRRVVSPRRQVLRAVLERGVDAGQVRPDADLDLMIELLVAPLLVRTVIRPVPVTDDQVAEIVDAVLAGVAPAGSCPVDAAAGPAAPAGTALAG